MEKKEALKVIAEKLEKGQSKQEIYKDLLTKVKFKSDLIQYIATVPNYSDKIKYKALNMTLFILLVFISISKFIFGAFLLSQISIYALPFAFLIPVISVYFAVSVWKFRGNMYKPLGMLGIAGILQSLSHADQFAAYNLQQIIIEVIFYIPAILVVILAYFVGTKVFPYYGFWGNLKEDKLALTSEQKP